MKAGLDDVVYGKQFNSSFQPHDLANVDNDALQTKGFFLNFRDEIKILRILVSTSTSHSKDVGNLRAVRT